MRSRNHWRGAFLCEELCPFLNKLCDMKDNLNDVMVKCTYVKNNAADVMDNGQDVNVNASKHS